MNRLILLFTVVLFMIISTSVLPNIDAYSQKNPTEKNTLNVKLDTDPTAPMPEEITKLKIEFINPQTDQIQQHIDYTISVENNGNTIFGPIPLTHTSQGSVTIPVTLENGKNTIQINVEGILFQPISPEIVTFDVLIGDSVAQSDVSNDSKTNENSATDNSSNTSTGQKIPDWIKNNAGWWAKNQIDDATFISGIQFLIKQGIISVSSSSVNSNDAVQGIPPWIKNNADWWSQGLISNDDFLKGIEFLVSNGIIVV